MQFASTAIYKQETEDNANIEERLIKSRKDFIYKQGYKSKGFVIYGVQSKAEQIEQKLLETNFRNGFEYMLFKYTTTEIKIGVLYTNNCKNVKAKYEVLYNICTRDLVKDKKTMKK